MDENKRRIERRLDEGLALLRKYYGIKEKPVDPDLATLNIGERPHVSRRFEIEGVGNLSVMTVTEAKENLLSTFVITPYYKNLPLFSTDYVYNGDRRFLLLEIYNLSVLQDCAYDAGIQRFADYSEKMADMIDVPMKQAWYDGIRPVCIAKVFEPDKDEESIQHFLNFLKLFVAMEQAQEPLDGETLKKKWQINKAYADRLIDEGGVSTDLFTRAIGVDKTRRFFHEVFFGADCFSPEEVES